MKNFRKKIYAAAGYNTIYFGPGRPEFNPNVPMPSFETYLKEAAKGTCEQIPNPDFDEGVIGSFMAARFISQANLPGFLPFMIKSLKNKPCVAVEGACGTGGRVIATGIKSILSDFADSVFISGFEIQNTVKSVYGADILSGAAYYNRERKKGHAYFFPNIFSDRAGAYYEQYGYALTRQAMAYWYQNAILNARKNPKAQEFYNRSENLLALGLSQPDPEVFLSHLNYYDCSKVSDGASSIGLFSEEGLKRAGIARKHAIEIVAVGEAVRDITKDPTDLTVLETTMIAVEKALLQANISLAEIGILEIHDCFTITALLALEAIGFAKKGEGAQFILEGNTLKQGVIPTNLSGGLGGFGHPTGASGVRQLVDLAEQLQGKAANQAEVSKEYAMMVSMGGNDITVTCVIVRL